MICSGQVAFSVLTLSAVAIAAFFTLTQTHKRKLPSSQCDDKKKPSSHSHEENKDFISKLSDDILISIITRVPLKCAIRTSILSKRWRNLYRYMSRIEFSCRDFFRPPQPRCIEPHDSNIVIDSVDKFLRLHSESSKILVFGLSCCFNKLTTDRFKEWTRALGRLDVEKLVVICGCFNRNLVFSFSFDLLSEIPSLKYFKLFSCSLYPSLSSNQFNSLQMLWLTGVNIYRDAVESVLSNCLRLHTFRIYSCFCPSKLCFRGPNLPLTNLSFTNCKRLKEIEFYAANLVLFEFASPQPVNFVFDHVPRLDSIYLSIYTKNVLPYFSGKVLKDLPHLKSLTFSTSCDHFQESIGYMGLFSNLSRLHLNLYETTRVNLLFLTPLLQICPLLEEFHLNSNADFLTSDEPEEKTQQQQQQAIVLHSQLKKMKMSGFEGTEDEIELALYILKSAIALETMHVTRCYKEYEGFDVWFNYNPPSWSEETRMMIRTRLQGQAISKTAQVIIRHADPSEAARYQRA